MLNYPSYFDDEAPVSTHCVDLGPLHLPTGHIYCCDPFLSREVGPLEMVVAPGAYPVQLCVATVPDWGPRVALARLVFSAAPVTAWREASYLLDGKRQHGFRVDAGLACFMDGMTRKLFDQVVGEHHASGPAANYYDDMLAAQFKLNADPANPLSAGDWAMHSPVIGNHLNIALFASGLGDGVYSARWGLDAAGQPAMLMADFGLLPLESAATALPLAD